MSSFLGKSTKRATSFLPKNSELFAKVQKVAKEAHVAMNFRDFSMFDMRIDAKGKVWILEANLFCSFGPKSILCGQARQGGLDDRDIFLEMANNVLNRVV